LTIPMEIGIQSDDFDIFTVINTKAEYLVPDFRRDGLLTARLSYYFQRNANRAVV
jgi:hypothetical protein